MSAERLYRVVLRLHPAEFRREYGDDMAEYFADCLRAERARGWRAVWWLVLRAFGDLLTTAARGHLARRRRSSTPHEDPMLQTVLHDLRFAARMLRKSPALTAAAVLVIALGTGAVSTIFSVANAVVLRPLPGVRDVDRVAMIERVREEGGTQSASYPYYAELTTRAKRMESIAAWSMVQLTASTGGQGVEALGNIVTGNYFTTLGVRPALGRFFAPDEADVAHISDASSVAVVSHDFWRRQLGGDSAAIGRSLVINGLTVTIVGVTPARFTGLYPVLRTDVWVPMSLQPRLRPGGDLRDPGSAWLELFGRLAPGATRAEAQTEIAGLTRQRATAPGSPEPKGMTRYAAARLTPPAGLPPEVAGVVTGFFAALLVVAALVLLIASVNVAGMLLARTVVRRREVAMRLALGADRGRLVRQLLTENLALFALGGVAGVLLAEWTTRLLARVHLPVDMPLVLDVTPDVRVLAVTIVVALLTGIVVAVAPAFRATRADPSIGLRGDDARSGRRRSRARDALIVGQVALSLVLLCASGLFLRALDRGRRVDPGFDVTNVATTALDVSRSGYDEARARVFYENLAQRLAATPGVTAVAYAQVLPLSMNMRGTDMSIPEYAPPGGQPGDRFGVLTDQVDAGYFDVVRLPIVSGRAIRPSDNAGAQRIAVVNETFARRLSPKVDVVGRTFKIDGRDVTVVGVVRDAKFGQLNETPEPFVFLPIAQDWRSGLNLLVRTSGDPATAAVAIRRTLAALDPTLPAPTLTTLQQATSVALLPQRFAVAVTGMLGVVGLVLAAVGLYGVLSFAAAQRTREMGVRLAFGARRADVVRLVVGEGARLIGLGMAIGLVLAMAGARALTPFLFGVSPVDPVTYGGIGLTLATVAFVASWLPARRAAAVDPIVSLRQS